MTFNPYNVAVLEATGFPVNDDNLARIQRFRDAACIALATEKMTAFQLGTAIGETWRGRDGAFQSKLTFVADVLRDLARREAPPVEALPF